MLNHAQQEAVETLHGPMLVLAGAGTGKTRVVTHRIANLIRHRTPSERILAVTFTRKAAGEMQERAMALLNSGKGGSSDSRPRRGKKPTARPQISTFHALCVQVLRRHITHLGYPPHFAICDRGDQESIARGACAKSASPTKRPPGRLAGDHDWYRSILRCWSIAERPRAPRAAPASGIGIN
jgi:DNA helicase-2/ATP-dependent DNA helicase PcrA